MKIWKLIQNLRDLLSWKKHPNLSISLIRSSSLFFLFFRKSTSQAFTAFLTILSLELRTKAAQPTELLLFHALSMTKPQSLSSNQLLQNPKREGPQLKEPALSEMGKWSEIRRAFLLALVFSNSSSHAFIYEKIYPRMILRW